MLAVEKRITSVLLVRMGHAVFFAPAAFLGTAWFSRSPPASSSHTQEPSSVEKIMEVDEHIGAAMSGLTADARTMVCGDGVGGQFNSVNRRSVGAMLIYGRVLERCSCEVQNGFKFSLPG